MQNIGIIAEFNPFHTGHQHIIDYAKSGENGVICVLSGNFVQRGDAAIIPKFDRARAALRCGADLVIELPVPYAMSTAQNFAFGAVSLLNGLGVTNRICFGSECGDIDSLTKIADLLESDEFNSKLSAAERKNNTFAKIRSDILREYSDKFADIIDSPNNTLGIEYIIAAKRIRSNIEFGTIKRIGAAHDSNDIDATISASLIRQHILKDNLCFTEKYMPKAAFDILKSAPISDIRRLETAILATLRTKTTENLKSLPDISEGIENRLFTAVQSAVALDDLYQRIKTKRYTLARVRRLVLSAFLGIDNSFFLTQPPYIRVLGFSEKGEKILREAKQKSTLPIVTGLSDINRLGDLAQKLWQTECLATDIYALSLNQPQECGKEYHHKIIKGEF